MVTGQGLAIVGAFVAKDLAKQAGRVAVGLDPAELQVVAGFVAHVAQQGPPRLAEVGPDRLAVHAVGLVQAQDDGAAVVPRHHRRLARLGRQEVEGQPEVVGRILLGLRLQPDPQQAIDQAALGLLVFGPHLAVARDAQVRPGRGEPAALAELLRIVVRDHPVAGRILKAGAAGLHRRASVRQKPPRCVRDTGQLEGHHLHPHGIETQGGAAVQALGVFKEEAVLALRAGVRPHGLSPCA